MKTYPTVEDYLEVLAGYRDVVTGQPTNNWFLGFTPIISLARYDVDVLTSMADATIANKALTQKQGDLLCKILLKYQRQLATKSIDVAPIENPVWRVKLRIMDYSRGVYINDDTLCVKFPYVTKLVEELRSFRSSSQGGCKFDNDKKVWRIALTEYNLNWITTWAESNQFEIAPEVKNLNQLLLDAESNPFAIELKCNDTGFEITNAPASLMQYINTNLGGLDHSNILRLVDASGVLGYTVEPAIIEALMVEYGIRFMQLSRHREVKLNPGSAVAKDDFASVLDYAIKVGRTPVVIYEPDMSHKLLNRLSELYPSDSIASADSKGHIKNVTEETKFIYSTRPIRDVEHIPMLISSAGMIFGGDKQLMMQRAEKVVYCAAEVYNKSNQGRKVAKIAD